MEMMEGLMTRRSVRKYTDQKIDKATLTEIIRAAQYAPTAHNRQPWEFLVVDDREVLANLRHIQRWTSFAKDAACVVFVLGDVSQSFNRDKENEKWSFGRRRLRHCYRKPDAGRLGQRHRHLLLRRRAHATRGGRFERISETAGQHPPVCHCDDGLSGRNPEAAGRPF